MPLVRIEYDRQIVAVQDGWITYRTTLRSLQHEARGSDPADWNDLDKLFTGVIGSFEIGEMDVYGRLGPRRVFRPEKSTRWFDKTVLRATGFTQVPAEALGVGARWRFVYDRTNFGETVQYRITSWHGALVTIEAQGAVSGPHYGGESTLRFDVDLTRGTMHGQRDATMSHTEENEKPAWDRAEHVITEMVEP